MANVQRIELTVGYRSTSDVYAILAISRPILEGKHVTLRLLNTDPDIDKKEAEIVLYKRYADALRCCHLLQYRREWPPSNASHLAGSTIEALKWIYEQTRRR